MSRWSKGFALLILWLAVPAIVAFVVARETESDAPSGGDTAVVAPVTLAERETTTLESRSIQPVLSGSGQVVASGSGFALEAPIATADLAYRLLDAPVGVKALIAGGPSGFDCSWIGIAPSSSAPGSMAMRCQIPADVRVVVGLSGTMVIQLSAPVQAQSLPVTAVIGLVDTGQVIVRRDDTTEVRSVELGVSDTFSVEIRAGLEPGERVLVAPVQADLLGMGS